MQYPMIRYQRFLLTDEHHIRLCWRGCTGDLGRAVVGGPNVSLHVACMFLHCARWRRWQGRLMVCRSTVALLVVICRIVQSI